jgi:hypothetical protein
MTQLLTVVAWLLLVAIVLAPLGYVVFWPLDSSFWPGVMSGALSTAAALVGGIPIALWIDRHIKGREESESAKEERTRELELLELIKEELRFSLNSLARRTEEFIEIQPLKSDLWAAISSAGKLNSIRSHRLLNRITSAYYVINVVREIERRGYIVLRSATVTFNNGQTALQQVWADARRFDGLLRASIEEAIRDIDADAAKVA